jgi:hypothetical protein
MGQLEEWRKENTPRLDQIYIPNYLASNQASNSSHYFVKGDGNMPNHHLVSCMLKIVKCRNLSLGLATKARGCKNVDQEGDPGITSHAPGSAKSVGDEPSPSQVSSHCGNWSSKWTLEFSERNFRGQSPSVRRVIYIIGKILKRRCLKWARISHLDI